MIRDRITILFFGDIAALVASFALMAVLRFDVANRIYLWSQLANFLLLFALWLLIFFIFDLYNVRRVNPNPRNIGLLALAVLVSNALSVIYFYLFPVNGTPKTNLVIVAGLALVLLIVWRRIFYVLFSSRFSQLIGVIGTGPAVAVLIEDIKRNPHIGRIIHIDQSYQSIEVIPQIDLLIAHDVDLAHLFEIAHQKDCDVLSLTDAYEELFGKVPLALVTEEKAVSVLTKRKHLSYRIIERLLELVFASLILIVVSPIVLLAMLAILIEDGKPLFYSQSRVGKNGKIFSIYKLRTMVQDAEAHGAQWADKHDSRVTLVGSILRKTHIDEVPQMYNVLKGDIAFIGPRPERPEFVADLEQSIPYYFLRHSVKPGFTGWAQIKYRYARSNMDSKEKFEYDLYWLFKRNMLLDIGIFLKTIQIIFTH